MTLFVETNDSDELVVVDDYGGAESVRIEDTGGPTEGLDWSSSWSVPERVKELVRQAIMDAILTNQIQTAIQLVVDAATDNIEDRR